MGALELYRLMWMAVLCAHDLDAQRTWPAVKFFDADKYPYGLRFKQDTFRHAFGQRLQKVQAFRG